MLFNKLKIYYGLYNEDSELLLQMITDFIAIIAKKKNSKVLIYEVSMNRFNLFKCLNLKCFKSLKKKCREFSDN